MTLVSDQSTLTDDWLRVFVDVVVEFKFPIQLVSDQHVLKTIYFHGWKFQERILWIRAYIPIIAPNTSSQANLLCGVAAEAELLRPAMPVPDQNS